LKISNLQKYDFLQHDGDATRIDEDEDEDIWMIMVPVVKAQTESYYYLFFSPGLRLRLRSHGPDLTDLVKFIEINVVQIFANVSIIKEVSVYTM
jgi:hypothetical protein